MEITNWLFEHLAIIGAIVSIIFVIYFSFLKNNNFKKFDYFVVLFFMIFSIAEHSL